LLGYYQKERSSVNHPFFVFKGLGKVIEFYLYWRLEKTTGYFFFDKKILSIIMDNNPGSIFFKAHFYVLGRMFQIQF